MTWWFALHIQILWKDFPYELINRSITSHIIFFFLVGEKHLSSTHFANLNYKIMYYENYSRHAMHWISRPRSLGTTNLYPFTNLSLFAPSPSFFFCELNSLFFRSLRDAKWYLSFSVWLLSLRITSPRPVHIVVNSRVPPFLRLYTHTHVHTHTCAWYFLYPLIDTLFSCLAYCEQWWYEHRRTYIPLR